MKPHWIDRVTAPIAPAWTLKRRRARVALTMLQRHFEGAASGRRTGGWNKSGGDVNAINNAALKPLREVARDLVRNNPWAESALSIITDHTVGYGIMAKPSPANKPALEAWKAWAETTACDADGRHDFYGLQKLVTRTVAQDGEVLVRRRIRFPEDNLPLPIQLQVLDADFLDTARDTASTLPNGHRIIQGVEFDAIGRRVAYWLFREHPGSSFGTVGDSVPVPAESVLHVFRPTRAGQVRAPSWFAPVLLRFKDFDEFEDATLMKQKIAACLSVIYSSADGSSLNIGAEQDPDSLIQTLEPGLIHSVPAGDSIQIVQPPAVREYPDYTRTVLRAIATGLGVTYEDLTGDYGEMNFSSSRASHIKHWQRVDDWRWRMLIPQFCDPVWAWAMDAAVIMRQVRGAAPAAKWTPPPRPMVNPVDEGLAYQRNIRNGLTPWAEVVRELGFDPDEQIEEIASFNQKLDANGIRLDCDPRVMTQAGQLQGAAAAAPAASDEDNEPVEDERRARPRIVGLRG